MSVNQYGPANKSSPDEIRRRFDADVERFSNLETGQTSTVDARLAMDQIAIAAARSTPAAKHVLDLGCGAGNYTLRLLQELPNLNVTLVDLSQPMLERARERISAVTSGTIDLRQGDLRELDIPLESTDIILAAAVLHHLRTDEEWEEVFLKLFGALRPGGSLWIFDLVEHEHPAVEAVQREGYGNYLTALKDETYRDHVFDYIAREDSPRSLTYQLGVMQACGLERLDVLHKHLCFAAFGGHRPRW